MYKSRPPIVSLCTGAIGILFVTYIGLIAMVMTYASLTVEFSQSVKNNESTVAQLESRYLDVIARITSMDYAAEGYAVPAAQMFVPAKSVTAAR